MFTTVIRRFNAGNALRAFVGAVSLSLAWTIADVTPAVAQATATQPRAETAQPAAKKTFKIFIIAHRSGAGTDDGFMEYFKSRNIAAEFTWRSTDGDNKRIPGYIAEIRAMKPDLVFVLSTDVALDVVGQYDKVDPAKHLTDIPVVFSQVGDPVGSRLVTDLEHPGRNVTGTVHLVPISIQLKAMQSYNPRTTPLKRLAVIYNPKEAYGRFMIGELRRLTTEQGITLIEGTPLNEKGNADKEMIVPTLQKLADQKPDLLYVPSVSFFGPHSKLLTEEAVARKLPIFAAIEVQLVQGKGLMGLVSPFYLVGQFSAYKAEQILVNNIPAKDIPIETLKRFSLIINMGVAKELELYPPISAFRFAQMGPN